MFRVPCYGGAIFEAEGITRDEFLSWFSMTDIMPINLPYKSEWKLFEKNLRATDPDLYKLTMTAFNTQHDELAAYLGININDSPGMHHSPWKAAAAVCHEAQTV